MMDHTSFILFFSWRHCSLVSKWRNVCSCCWLQSYFLPNYGNKIYLLAFSNIW